MMLMCPLLALSVVDRGQHGKTDSSEAMQPHTQQTDANKQYTQYSDTFLSETALTFNNLNFSSSSVDRSAARDPVAGSPVLC